MLVVKEIKLNLMIIIYKGRRRRMSMKEINLEANEGIILKSTEVLHGGVMASYSDELILTNLNIIYVARGMFGKIKNIEKYPIKEVKVFEDKAQCFLGKQVNGAPSLEIYFYNKQESFGFRKKTEVMKWVKSINEVLCENTDVSAMGQFALPGTEFLAETIKDTISSFKGILEKKEKVSTNCISCGAAISGYKGKQVQCSYCNTHQTLQ